MTQGRIDLCLAAEFFYPAFTGAGVRFLRYAPGLRARGIDMRVFAGARPDNQRTAIRPENPMRGSTILPVDNLHGLAIQRVQLSQAPSYSRDLQYARALLDYCRRPATRPDLIHLTTASQHWLPFYFSFRRLGIPIIQSHTLLSRLSSRNWKRYLQRSIWKRLTFQLADCVVTASVVGRDALRNIGVTKRIEVIPNGLDLIRFKPVASTKEKLALRLELGLDATAELILFVGAPIERKGVDILIKAWRAIARKRSRAYLILVGPNSTEIRRDMYSSEFQNWVETTIASSGAPDRVIVTGWVENVEDFFRAADVFVFPSRREGMPNAVLEALGCGVATILTPFIGLSAEYGQPGEHYILVERAPKPLARAIVALLENPSCRQSLARKSRQWAEAHLSIETSLDQYVALYRDLIDRSRNGKRHHDKN